MPFRRKPRGVIDHFQMTDDTVPSGPGELIVSVSRLGGRPDSKTIRSQRLPS